MANTLYAVIMAGGQGTRLWPLSREATPKQFTDIVGRGQTMLQATVDRLVPMLPLDHVLVVSGEDYAELVHEQLTDLPTENLVLEPSPRNTAPAIGLAMTHLALREPEATVAVLPADHMMADNEGFRQALQRAAEVAAEGNLVTLGIAPDRPHTGYGYIQRGPVLADDPERPAYEVRRFLEKPDRETAEQFLQEGGYYWNGGIFVFKIETMQREIERQLPALDRGLRKIGEALGSEEETERVAEAWSNVPQVSIDYGVMEQARQVAVVPMDVGWNDLGDWAALRQVMPANREGHVVINGEHLGMDSSRATVYGRQDRLIVTLGIDDIIVVDSGNALLVCPRKRAQDVKAVVEELERRERSQYL